MEITIADLPITGAFRVYDITRQQYIFSLLFTDPEETGDIPPDIAFLPVLNVYATDGVIIIDTKA